MDNNFLIGLTAFLNKDKSKTQIQSDAKQLGDANIKVPLVGTLDKAKTKVQLRQDLASMKGTINLTGKVNQKSIVSSVQQATQQAQRAVGKNPIQLNFNLKKDKLINDLRILGQQNSKMFKNADMSAKYNSLLNNAKLATSGKELQNLRLQLSAMRSEIKATNLSGLTLGDTFKKTFKQAPELFSGTAGVMLISKQLKEAWTQAIELDTAFTDLVKVQDELSRSDYANYLDRCNKKAQELATTQKSLIEGVTEFSRSGYNLTESNALAEKSTILSNVGEMSAEDASKALISGIQAYKDIDGYTNAIDKATQLIDKYNVLGYRASITSEELAKGVEAVGSVFADANTDVNQFLSMLSAGNRQYQDANSLALGLRTSALRIRAAKVDLKSSGEDTDGVKSVLDNQKAIKKLTNVDILEKDEKTVRSIYDIFLDISKVYQQMNDTDQSALLKIIAGTHRASAVSAVLNNMSEAQKLYKISLQSTGSAQKEYDQYMQSSQASLNKFKASVTETYQSIITGNTAKTILDIGNAAVKLANNLGLVSSTLRGFLAIGVVKVLTTLTTAFKTSAIQASNFGTALNTVKNMSSMTRGTTEYTNALNLLKTVSAGLTETQLKQVLANEALYTSDKVRILQATGLSKSQANAKLAQMGLTQATQAQTAANASATASTFSLSAAVKGFGANLKAAFLSNPIGISIMAISMAVGAISSAVSSANQEVEEARQKAKDAADTASTLSDELSELSGKYLSLSESVKTNASSKEEFMNVQDELLKKLGLEGESVDKLISKYGSLDEAVKNVTIKELGEKENDLLAGVKAAEDELKDVGKGYEHWYSMTDRNLLSSSGDDAVKAYKVLNKAGIISNGSYGTGGGSLALIGDDSTIEGILKNYHKLQDAMKALRESDQFTEEELKNNPVFNQIYNRSQQMKESVEGYNDSILKLNKNVAQQQTLKALKGKNLPNSEKEFDTFIDNIIKNAQIIKEFIGSQKDIKTAINSYLSSIPELSKYYNDLSNSIQNSNKVIKQSSSNTFDSAWSSLKDSEQKKFTNLVNSGKLTAESFNKLGNSAETLKQTGLSVESLCDKIRDLVSLEQKLRNMSTAFKKVGTAYKDFKKNGFVSSSSLNSMSDAFKNLKGYSQFSKIVGNKKSSKSDIQNAFNDITSEYLNTYHVLSGLTDKTKDKIITALRDAGITNANDLIKQYEKVHNTNTKLLNESEKNYIKYLNSKGTNSEITNKKINQMNAELINALGKQYKTDYDNWLKLIQDKIKAYNAFVSAYNNASPEGQAAYEGLKSENNQTPVSENKGIKSSVNAILKNPHAAIEADMIKRTKQNYDKKKKQADKAKKKLQLKLDKIDANYVAEYSPTSASGSGSGSKSNSKDKTKATAQIFDFIERRINKLTKTIDYAKSKVEALFSVGAKNNQLDKAIKNTTALVNAQRKAAARYQAYANKLAGVATKTTKKTVKETTGVGNDIVKSAKKYVGKLRYVWGGVSLTNGADCSGFAQQIFKKYGINIPRTSREQWANIPGKKIKNKKDLQKGDLVFFGNGGKASNIHHVGIYAGNGKFVESPYSGKKVRVSSLSDRIARKHDFVGGIRANAVGKGTTTKQIKVKGLKKSQVNKYVKLIENGSLTKDAIKSIKNEKLKTFIENYQTYYDKAQDAKRAVQENIASIVELNKQKLDNITSHYDTLISKIEATTSRLEAQLSVQKTVNSLYNNGETGSTSTYNSLLTGSSSEIKKYIAEKKTYNKERKSTRRQLNNNLKKSGVSKSQRKSALADFDATTKAQIDNFNTSIFNAESKLYEYAQSLAALPWDKATAKIEKLSTSYDILQAKLSNGTSVDGKNKILDQMNDNLDSQSSTKESALKTDKKNVKNSALWINKNTKIKVTAGKLISKAQLKAIENIYGKNSKQYKEAVAYNKSVKALNSDKSKAKNTTSWLNKNTNIKVKDDKLISKKQLAKIKKRYGKNSQQYKKAVQHNNSVKAVRSDKKNVDKSALWINKNAQIKVTAGKLISKDQLSAIKGIYGKDSKQYKEAVKYNSYVKKMQTDQDDYDKSVEENKTNKAENFKTQFTNIQSDFERTISDIEAKSEHIENAMSVLETKGYKANAHYYERLAQISGDTIAKNTDELMALENKLQEGLDNGTIQVGTDPYYEMIDVIANVKKNIDDATLSQAQFLQKVRETNEELKEHARTAISDLNDEADFYQDILSYKDAYDDNGNMTKEGKSRFTLSMTKMSNDIALNNKYNEAIAELDAEYDNGNGKIGYDDYYTKRKELVSQQRESIKNYYSEIDAIKSLIEEGYNAQKDALSDLISKYTDALDAAKNLHDYEKSIKEKTENIDSIKKRIAALQGNDTEEARQKIQKLQIDLKKAKEDLDETQYEQYINDQKDILNEMQNDYEKFVEEQLKDVDDLIRKLIEGAKENTQDVLKVLESLANKWDIDLSAILKNDMEKGDFSSVDNKDSNAVDNANKHYDEDKKNEEYNPPAPDDNKSNNSSDDEDPDTNSHKKKEQEEEEERRKAIEEANQELIENLKKQDNNNILESKPEKDSPQILQSKLDPKEKSKMIAQTRSFINTHGKDIPKDKISSYVNKKIYAQTKKALSKNDLIQLAKNLGVKYDNASETGKLAKRLKEIGYKGFSTGGVVGELNKVATDNGDDGWITVKTKERVLTARQNNLWEKWTKNLPELVNISDYLPSMSEYMPKIPDMAANMQVQNGGNSVNIGDISYTMEFPNVTDPASMKEAIKQDTSLQDMLRDVTIGQANKGNKLGIMKY